MRVTWLLPVKNGMPFLRGTLASIEAQTYQNWEIIAWDNGSTDGSVEELRSWIPQRLPGQIIEGSPLTLGASLAAMVEMASTHICARIDADDVNLPERLQQQIKFMQSHPHVGLLGANMEFIDENSQPATDAPQNPLLCSDADLRWSLRWHNTLFHPTVMFRREAVLQAGNYGDFSPGQDYDLWLRMTSFTEMANLPQCLLKYRLHNNSVTAIAGRDYSRINQEIAGRNTQMLFPQMVGDEALAFRKKFLRSSDVRTSVNDILRLRRVATFLARSVGKPDSYFRSTQSYKRRLLVGMLKCLTHR